MDRIEIQIARHDEQIKAMREELRSGFDRMVEAFKAHAEEDREQYKRIEKLEKAWIRAVGIAIGASAVVQTAFAMWQGVH